MHTDLADAILSFSPASHQFTQLLSLQLVTLDVTEKHEEHL